MNRHAPSIGLGLALSLRSDVLGATGPLDLVSGASAAYSLRALSRGWLAGDVVEVRRSSDSTTQDFTASQIANGELVAFCGVGDGFVSTWYDQSGNANDATQATTTAQPKIVDAGALVTGGIEFDGVDDRLNSALVLNSTNTTMIAVCVNDASVGGVISATDAFNDGHELLYTSSTSARYAVNFADITETTPSGSNLLFASYDGSTQLLAINGVPSSQTVSETVATTSTVKIGMRAGNPFTGSIEELILYTSDQSANRAAIESNINDYYGIY